MKTTQFMCQLLLLAPAAFAESWTGTVVDVMCKSQDLANHTTKCAVKCSRGGYGLVLSDGKFVKFDEGGNTRALAMLKSVPREKNLKAKVTGTSSGDLIKVQAIELQ